MIGESVPGPSVLVIYNPVAGWRRRYRFEAVMRELKNLNCRATIRRTEHAGHASELTAEVEPGAFDVIAIAGGDGTINEAINGLGLSGERAPAVAIIPLGTANVLALELGLSLEPVDIARTIASGAEREIYLGQVNGRKFSMMAGVGFDAQVVDHVDPKVKRILSKGAYVLETLRQMLCFTFPKYEVSIAGQTHRAGSLIAANGHYYGGAFVCAPEAGLDRPGFEAVIFRRSGRLNALRYASALVLGLLPKLADVSLVNCRSIRVEGPVGEPVQADGDIVAFLPATIEMAKERLAVLVPA
jgi:diacylglycerol kinase (ATP)